MIRLFSSRKGHYFLIGNKAVVFGNRHLTWEDITSTLPFPVHRLRQVHSDRALEQPSQEPLPEADGHWAETHPLGLAVYTADCAPVLVVHPTLPKMAAFHCGWRGVAAQLLSKNLPRFEESLKVRQEMLGFIGAHILWDSFEVEPGVGEKILQGLPGPERKERFVRTWGDKWLVDLRGILKQQALSQGLRISGEIYQDTFVSSRYHSARRGPGTTERQWSVVLQGEGLDVLVPQLMA